MVEIYPDPLCCYQNCGIDRYGNAVDICMVHGEPSKYLSHAGPHRWCLAKNPYLKGEEIRYEVKLWMEFAKDVDGDARNFFKTDLTRPRY